MKRILLLVFVSLAFCLIGEPKRGISAAEGIEGEEDRNYTASDYIQDGLVAMYDGVENAGYGIHDSNSTKWIDLSGYGHDLIQGGSTAVSFGDDCAHFTKKAYLYGDAPEMYDAVIDGEFTATVVFRITSSESTNAGLFGLGRNLNTSQGRTLWMFANSATSIQAHNFNAVSGIPCGEAHLGEISSLTFAGDGSIYLNGRYYASATPATNDRKGNKYLALGRLGYLNDYMIGDIFSVRGYAKTLTAEEVAYNHFVDKMRFGL